MEGPAAPIGRRFDAVLIGSDVSRGDASVRAAGGCSVAAFGWGEEIRIAGRPVLVIEAQGADEQTIADALPDVARFAVERGCRVVAAFDREAIDVVAASLLGAGVELLCDPDLPERIEALLRASNGRDDPEPLLREEGGENGAAFGVEPPSEPVAEPRDLRRAIRSRRLRDEFFMPGLFADPAWDMLLDLYAAELEDQPVSVSSLCIAAAVAPTTALRWIARMQEDGLLQRKPDANDRRRAFMVLTEVARLGMRQYLLAVKRAGLSVA
ncbi:hypothetical protein [Sphingomonas lenta]|uniref:hypothetical protein n=1 Tax=Sphingomonas lenta TaxID=1141887 RepID=UPI000BB39DFB|nr:hypothetical protein [Sphingomonas lenta]